MHIPPSIHIPTSTESRALGLPPADAVEFELDRRRKNKLASIYPDTGPYRRELYPKHMEVIRATRDYAEVGFVAGNRVGKSVLGSFIMAVHLTGRYPKWWDGRRFKTTGNYWACGNSATDVRDINQVELIGDFGSPGTGMIPAECILDMKSKSNVPNGIELVYVRHVSGGVNILTFKSYEQSITAYYGRKVLGIWADEEMPNDIYGECLVRLMTTGGHIWLTYTPLKGLSPLTVSFFRECVNKASLPEEVRFDSMEGDGEGGRRASDLDHIFGEEGSF